MKIYDPDRLGLQVARIMGNELQVFCPYHFDSNPSAEYNIEKGLFYCFGCHTSKTARQIAADMGGSLVPMRVIPEKYKSKAGVDMSWLDLTKTKRAVGNAYLQKRKVYKWQVEKHDIRQNEDGVLFPLYDRFGEIKGMQIRHYEREPKYLFYGERPPLWPMEKLVGPTHRGKGRILITEGVFGALRLEHQLDSTVAILGSSSIEKSSKILKSLSNQELVAIMDRDFAGQVAAGKFILHGIPAFIIPRNWPDSPDEFNVYQTVEATTNPHDYTTSDVMDIIESSDSPERLQNTLEKYWRKIQ